MCNLCQLFARLLDFLLLAWLLVLLLIVFVWFVCLFASLDGWLVGVGCHRFQELGRLPCIACELDCTRLARQREHACTWLENKKLPSVCYAFPSADAPAK